MKERRHYSSDEVSFPVLVLTSHGTIEGEVREISLSGAVIYCREPPHRIDEILTLSIEIPRCNYTLLASAEVEELEACDSESGDRYYSVRVSFAKIRACPVEEVSLPDKLDN
ncbi:MAG: PilZ domain-containing protein [Candidatus Hermodarchaeota archaeon]